MALTLSRIDRVERIYDLGTVLAGQSVEVADIAGVEVALLTPRTSPDVNTVWTAVTFATPNATVLLAGPDADDTGAVVVPSGGADLWMRVGGAPEVQAVKVERVVVLHGGAAYAPPVVGQTYLTRAGADAIYPQIEDVEAEFAARPTATLTTTRDGTAAVHADIQAAATAAVAAGVPLLVPDGDYLCTQAVALPAGLHLIAAPGARFFGTRLSAPIVTVGSNTILDGLTVENNANNACIGIDVRGGTTNLLIRRCVLLGAGSTQTININSAGVSNVDIEGCRFDGASYAVLTNDGANDIKNVAIRGCTFRNIYSDAIEFNHPAPGSPAAIGFLVEGCDIEVPVGKGSGSTAGFGIGVAGAADVRIVGNQLRNVRHEAIHIEDGCRRVTVVGNTISNVTGADATAAIAVYSDCQDITIADNVVQTITGHGIWLVYDVSPNPIADITITGNTIEGASQHGISGGSDSGGGFVITGNRISGSGQDGIKLTGGLDRAIVHGNLITGCAGYGLGFDTAGGMLGRVREYRDNVITGCTLGDYQPIGISGGNALAIRDRHAVLDPTPAASGGVLRVPLMRLGRYAKGQVTVQGRRITYFSHRIDAVWDVEWTGTGLLVTRLAQAKNGAADNTGLEMVDGVLTAVIALDANNGTMQVSSTFTGISFEDGSSNSGTIVGIAPASGGSGSTLFPPVRVRTDQATAVTAVAAAIPFNLESFDADGWHDPVTNPSRLTVPTGRAGKYRILGFIRLAAGTGARSVSIRKNGTEVIESILPGTAGVVTTIQIEDVLDLAVGDFVELGAYAGTSTTLDTAKALTNLSLSYVGP